MKFFTKQRLLLGVLNVAIIAIALCWHHEPVVRAKITSIYSLLAQTIMVPVQLTATGTTPITWSITAGALPPGLSLASDTGIISGTPTIAGTYTFTAKATNFVGSDSKSFIIRVNPAGCFITTTSLTGAVISTAYSQPLNQSGCTGSWSVSSGTLPPGLSLNTTTGVISGTPTTVGASSFTVAIGSDTQTLSITVAATGACTITATSLAGAISGTAYSQTPASSGCSGTWSISSGLLPPGLSLNSSTGAITGTPTTAGTFAFTLTNGSASRPLSIVVSASCSITTSAFATGTSGTAYSQALTDVGCSGSWSATGLPAGFAVSGSTIIGNPIVPSTSTVTVSIGTASKAFTLTIAAGIGGFDGNIDMSQMQTRVLSGGLDSVQFATTDGTHTPGDGVVWGSNGNLTSGPVVTSLTTTGTSGSATLSGGTLNVPNYTGGGGGSGSLVFLESHTASSSSELDFTAWYSTTYDQYLIEIVNVVPATNAVSLLMRVSTNGGSSYDSGSNYAYQSWRWITTASAQAGSLGTTSINLDGGAGTDLLTNTAANGGLCGTYKLFNPGSTATNKLLTGQTNFFNTASKWDGASIGASYLSTSAVNALQILASSGNLTSGTVRVYGISH